MKEILKCISCGSFALKALCACGANAMSVIPMKYSPLDKYAGYRRKAKEEERLRGGML